MTLEQAIRRAADAGVIFHHERTCTAWLPAGHSSSFIDETSPPCSCYVRELVLRALVEPLHPHLFEETEGERILRAHQEHDLEHQQRESP